MNDRDESGQFVAGHNSPGPGRPKGGGGRMAELREALICNGSEEDMRKLYEAMLREALDGNVQAAKLVCDRLLGKPVELDLIERIEELESALEATQ